MKKINNFILFAVFAAISLPFFSGCASIPPAATKSESTLSAAPAAGEKDAEIEKIRSGVAEELKNSLREEVKSEVKEELAREMGKVELSAAAPEWAQRVRFGGDIRQRQDNDRSDRIRTDYAAAAPANPPSGYSAPPDRMPNRMNVQMNMQTSGQGLPDNSVAALADLLKRKNVISSDEAARFTGPSAGEAPASGGMAELVALLQTKNVLSADEAASLAGPSEGQSGVMASRGTGTAVASEAADRERLGKITQNVTQEVMKGLQEQVKKQVSEELPAELKQNEKQQVDKITADVTQQLTATVQEQVKTELEASMPEQIAKRKEDFLSFLPEWIRRINFSGDIRLRYEGDRFGKDNAEFYSPLLMNQAASSVSNFVPFDYNTDHDAYKYRVRLRADAIVNDQMNAIISLSTGNTGTPVSTNSIFGTFMNKDNVLFDLAYVKWRPADFLTFYGGRMPNPFFSTDLVWSRDLNFEGLAVDAHVPVTESWKPFFTAGIFPLQQPTQGGISIQREKWLGAGQVGVEKVDQKGIGAKVGAAYYEFTNITGIFNSTDNPNGLHANDWTAPLYMQKGNTLIDINVDPSTGALWAYASKFRELDITGQIDVGLWDPYHVVLLGDFVKNIAYNQADIIADFPGVNVAIPRQAIGYQAGMSVGYPVVEKFGQWKTYVYYKRLESDAVVDAFTDADFHLGGTNSKGWVLGTDFGLHKNAWLTLRWLTADQITGPPLAIDVFQADFNVRF